MNSNPTGDFPQILSSSYSTSSLADRNEFDTFQHQQVFVSRRLVQVFIADPHPEVPLSKALLYRGDLVFTDASDQELYFEIPVMELLKTHNASRAALLDKEATKRAGKDIFLEPAKVRDLKMVVVTVAQF